MRPSDLLEYRTNPREKKTIARSQPVLGRSVENRAVAHRARTKHCLAVAASLRNGATPAPRAPANP